MANGLAAGSNPHTSRLMTGEVNAAPKRSFGAFAFKRHQTPSPVVNVSPVPSAMAVESQAMAPEIRKYKKKFHAEILCASLWGVNLLVGTENGLLLLDRSGHGKGGIC